MKTLGISTIRALMAEFAKGTKATAIYGDFTLTTNMAAVTAAKLFEANLSPGNSGGAVDGTVGSYTFADGANPGSKKVTITPPVGITAAASGIATHIVVNDGTNIYGATTFGPTSASGTAQAGAASTITLAATASAADGFYAGYGIRITAGPGVGQVRIISGYAGATRVATISNAWTTQPTSTSTYEIFGLAVTASATYNPQPWDETFNQPA
jgi:hypothetical protein